MWNDFNPSRYWGQWESHYGPAQRRVATRRHQAEAMFGPIVGQRPAVAVMGPPTSVGFVPAAIIAPVGLLDRVQPQNRQLYYDFNAPTKPNVLSVRCAVQSIKADIQWNSPRINKGVNYSFKITINGNPKGDIIREFPPWKTSASVDLDPGNWYTIKVEAVSGGRTVAAGDVKFKSILCAAEMATLQTRAISYLQSLSTVNQMQEIIIFYRNKPPEYWQQIQAFDSVMHPYLKDQCGNPGSPINGEILGLFFAARLHNGMLPTSSPFGGQRLKLLCPRLFLPETHNMYFGDFYCNTYVHYVTVVICHKNSPVDVFCRDKLDQLDPFNNLFLRLSVDEFGNYRYFINNNVWVEVYFTGDVPLWWGEFDITVSLGQSKPNGIPNNKYCKICNLYPLDAPPKQSSSASENDKKRRHPDESSTSDESDTAKRLKADWPEITLPLRLDFTKENDKHSTFQLSMAICRKLMSNADESPNSNSYDEYLPHVVDVICFLVDNVDKSVSAEKESDEKIPDDPRQHESTFSEAGVSDACKSSPSHEQDQVLIVKLPPHVVNSKFLIDKAAEKALIERVLAYKVANETMCSSKAESPSEQNYDYHSAINLDALVHEVLPKMPEEGTNDKPNLEKIKFETAEIETKLKKLGDSLANLKNYIEVVEKKIVSIA